MDFISNRQTQVEAIYKFLEISSFDELITSIPKNLKLKAPLEDDGLSEYEGMQLMQELAKKNTYSSYDSYLGAGAYEHYVPAIVKAVCAKSEFLTSYTPYQAEASQGMLQATFEFQSVVTALTGMDVANASLYDGATACVEALLMSMRLQKERNKVIISSLLHPHYKATIEQYLSNHETKIEWISFDENGCLREEAVLNSIDQSVAAVLVSYPNFFGVIEKMSLIKDKAKAVNAHFIVCANPLAYGLFSSAGELGADIAVGDMQPFGLPLQFGGPYVGYIACKQDLVRQLPGRLVGETKDINGKRAFVLTLQAREQHIRREKATSNICTNQALAALATLVSVLWYGNSGVKDLSLTNFQRAAYLKSSLETCTDVKTFKNANFFNEFVVSFGMPFEVVEKHFKKHGIISGLDLGRFFPEMSQYVLVCVTEMKSKKQLDHYKEVATTLIQGSK